MPDTHFEITYNEHEPWNINRVKSAVHRLRIARANDALDWALADPELASFAKDHPKLIEMLSLETQETMNLLDFVIDTRAAEDAEGLPVGAYTHKVITKALSHSAQQSTAADQPQ